VSKNVTVLPAGTFKLVGTVLEAGAPSWPVRGALVEVTTGVGERLNARTDESGTYRLYGVSGEIGLRVTGDRYQPATRSLVVSNHGTTYDVELPLAVPPPDMSGVYTLTITAAASCGVGLGQEHVPEEARVRTYQANVRQNGSRAEVTLSGSTLGRHIFFGRVEAGRVQFSLGEWDWNDFYTPLITEQLPSSRWLGIEGFVTAPVSANHLSGALDGSFSIRNESEYGWYHPTASCYSENHQFVLSR
jgi:hypothetical protein